MSDDNEIKEQFRYEQDSKRYHRFQIETDEGIIGTCALIMAIAAMNNSEEEKPFVNKYEREGLLIL